MIFEETKLKGASIIHPERISDVRGFFARAWCINEFRIRGLNTAPVQSNISFNIRKGTLRGMHYQTAPFAETKLVRCTRGAIYDVIIDIRPESSTYMQWMGVELTMDNHSMLYVPEGFAHGYQTLTDNTEVFYQVSQLHAPECERGIRWNDPAFNIKWPDAGEGIISEKDRKWPDFIMT
ncbi:dTDP-4-dehydrorhamnose 3,5-epimerase [candidate division WS5 bacterium]|uniref:dTDP-4-dehydrorhamnose 3,5-epimerase n=1 Tax=candidate division WS5 bacterium TaxID=2093353 RepID=A0A419DFD2_9BACT|nr:MAG: dTDP-4-dehydrorhamnose 3,5-epimerase [candidate division WS5 bacterium]